MINGASFIHLKLKKKEHVKKESDIPV